jgi:hypothetical protein
LKTGDNGGIASASHGLSYTTNGARTRSIRAFTATTKIILYGKWFAGWLGTPKMNLPIAIRCGVKIYYKLQSLNLQESAAKTWPGFIL